ncbi:hypothetical protein M0R19_04955 [Candidatus Pacearchaeota archaeon]|nr:hypothetical protein [Candidatus Pacearchaeota archaeon]
MEVELTYKGFAGHDVDIYDKDTGEKIGYVQYSIDWQTGERYISFSGGDDFKEYTAVFAPKEEE